MTNEATLWYVPTSIKTLGKVLSVPKISYASPDSEAAGWDRYHKQLAARERQGLGRTVSLSMEEIDEMKTMENREFCYNFSGTLSDFSLITRSQNTSQVPGEN